MTDAVSRLHPVVQHHIVNTLGWPGLRPLQEAAVEPVLDGVDALLLAPTAGGKTEAASFPVLSRMAVEGWTGVSVLYVCPLRALLSNLEPRLGAYASWLGRTASLWHGDTGAGARARVRRDRPDVVLTTPESLESMLVSTALDAGRFFADLRVVVVDEVHAFAGDDRGSHLLAVLERLEQLAARPVQRVGLSATVGNPEELLAWLQGPHQDRRRTVAAVSGPPPESDVTLDHVGSVDGASKVIAGLHGGEKRLVFVDSRRRAEELGTALRARDVTTYLSHSSLSAAERRRSEEAFADARDCVIVATSTLELGVDVGDLDRVIQLGAPRTVASFLQRLGRTGRRGGAVRNCLFLGLDQDEVLHAAGLLQCWSRGWVEPITAPVLPRHIAAQQLLALALQEGAIGTRTWPRWWSGLDVMESGTEVLAHLLAEGFVERDGDLAVIGPESERRFGRRHFSELLAVFTAPPEFTVLEGRREIGMVGDDVLVADTGGAPRVLLLGGRTWLVVHVDWKRRRAQVEPTDLPGRARWSGAGSGLSFAVTRGMRDVLLGADPVGVTLSRRATGVLDDLRTHHAGDVDTDRTVLRSSPDGDLHWWTWAGTAANRTLAASLPDLVDPAQRFGDRVLRLHHGTDARDASRRLAAAAEVALVTPAVNDHAVRGLKFSAALPIELARQTVAERLVDREGARHLLGEPRSLHRD